MRRFATAWFVLFFAIVAGIAKIGRGIERYFRIDPD